MSAKPNLIDVIKKSNYSSELITLNDYSVADFDLNYIDPTSSENILLFLLRNRDRYCLLLNEKTVNDILINTDLNYKDKHEMTALSVYLKRKDKNSIILTPAQLNYLIDKTYVNATDKYNALELALFYNYRCPDEIGRKQWKKLLKFCINDSTDDETMKLVCALFIDIIGFTKIFPLIDNLDWFVTYLNTHKTPDPYCPFTKILSFKEIKNYIEMRLINNALIDKQGVLDSGKIIKI